jgi:hypothetical protein
MDACEPGEDEANGLEDDGDGSWFRHGGGLALTSSGEATAASNSFGAAIRDAVLSLLCAWDEREAMMLSKGVQLVLVRCHVRLPGELTAHHFPPYVSLIEGNLTSSRC